MPVTIEDILALGRGPLQQTWADQEKPKTPQSPAPPTTTPEPKAPTTTPEPEPPATPPVTDDVLAQGKGPIQTTWADQPKPSTAQSYTPATTTMPNRAVTVTQTPVTAVYDAQRSVVNETKPQTETDVEHVAPVSEQQTTPEKKKLSYVEMFQQMSPYKPPTPEELEKERKKQKRESIFAAISDGISALSNLYFTTQYAPNAFDPSKGMAATTKARFDQLKKDREENLRQYMEGFMRAMRWDAEDERDARNWQHTLERDEVTDRYKEATEERAQAKADRDAAMAELRMDLMQGRIDHQGAAARAKKIEADYADAYWRSRIGKNNYRRPEGGGQRTSTWSAVDPATGEVHKFEASSEANAYSIAGANGWQITGKVIHRTTTKGQSRSRETTETESSTRTGTAGNKGKGYGDDKEDNENDEKGRGY